MDLAGLLNGLLTSSIGREALTHTAGRTLLWGSS